MNRLRVNNTTATSMTRTGVNLMRHPVAADLLVGVGGAGGGFDHLMAPSLNYFYENPTGSKSNAHLATATANNNNNNNENSHLILDKILNPFRRLTTSANKSKFTDPVQRKKLFHTQRRKSQLFEELDAKTQLLINYARVDAIANSKLSKFSELLFSGQALGLMSSTGGGATAAGVESHTPRLHNKSSLTNSKTRLESSVSNQKINGAAATTNEQVEDTSFTTTNSRHAFDENSLATRQLMTHALFNLLLNNRRRRHSWPRCKLDNLQYHNFNREVRLFCYRNQLTGTQQRNYPPIQPHQQHPPLTNKSSTNSNMVRDKDQSSELDPIGFYKSEMSYKM